METVLHGRTLREVALDLDSTLLTVYGKQGGARVGCNPHKPGKRSYHPLLCSIADTGDYLHGKLRKWDAASATGLIPFFKKCLNRLPETVERIRVHAAAGFYSGAFFDLLEAKDIGYAVPPRVTRRLGQRLTPVSYTPVAADIEVGEPDYQAASWDKARRMLVIRKTLPNRPDPQVPLLHLGALQLPRDRHQHNGHATREGLGVLQGPGSDREPHRGGQEPIQSVQDPLLGLHGQHLLLSDGDAAYNLTNWIRRLLLWGELRKAEVANSAEEGLHHCRETGSAWAWGGAQPNPVLPEARDV